MKITIFGAGGYIGRHLANRLSREGDQVTPISSSMSNVFDAQTGILHDSVEVPAGTDCVVYLAQSPFHRKLPEMAAHLWGVNVVSTFKAAERAYAAGAQRFIYASTGNVYAPGFSPHKETSPLYRDDWYALSKVHAEEGLSLYKNKMSVTAARIFGVYGPNQTDRLVPNLIHSVRSGATIKLAPHPHNAWDNGGLRVSLCYIEDIVDIFFSLIHGAAPESVNIAGPEALSVRDIANAVGKELGIKPQFELTSQPRKLDLIADIEQLVEKFHPAFTPFEAGLKRTLNF